MAKKNVVKSVNLKEMWRTRRWQLVVGLVVLVLLVLFLLRGWIRNTIIPRSAGVFVGNSVQTTADQQLSKLGDPFKTFGYTNINRHDYGGNHTVCTLGVAHLYHTEVNCQSGQSAYNKTTEMGSSKKLNAAAVAAEKALKSNGWDGVYGLGGSRYTSLTRLVKSVTNGIDYQPDAFYQKHVGNITCTFDSIDSFSKPGAPAISSHYSCSRTIDVLGSPWVVDSAGNLILPGEKQGLPFPD